MAEITTDQMFLVIGKLYAECQVLTLEVKMLQQQIQQLQTEAVKPDG